MVGKLHGAARAQRDATVQRLVRRKATRHVEQIPHPNAGSSVRATPARPRRSSVSDTIPAERLAYSPAEAAELLGISRARLYQLLDDGTLPSVKLGRRRLVRREALVELLDSHPAA